MTLEDFFTLTEMKNGLATLSRVEELISVMQQQKNCAMNNLSDTARQWSTVASMLAATENKDCLTHFVKSNGLSYLNHWLQEALKCSNDVAGFAVEKLLNALLGSLERLPITEEDSVASGIQFVVEQLIGSKSIDIKEKARTLSERWKHAIEKDVSYHHMNKDEKCKDDDLKHPGDVCVVDGANLVPPQVVEISTCKEEPEASNAREKSAGCMDIPRSDIPSDLLTSTANKSIPANAKSEDMDALPSTLVPNSCREDLSGACCSNASEDVADNHRDVSARKDDIVLDMKMDVDRNEGHPSESDQKESSEIPPASDLLSVSSLAHKPERSVSCNFDAKEIKPHKSDTMGTLLRSASIDCVVPTCLRNVDLKPDMQDVLSNGSKLRIKDDLVTSLDKKEEIGSTGKVEGSKGRLDTVASLNSLNAMDRKSIVGMDQSSELGLEYGEIDALEVARQVAIEVEREVVDYREPFCSSSPDCNSSEEMGPQCSEDPKDRTAYVEQNGKDHDDASSSLKDGNKLISESGADKGADKCVQDVEMSMDAKISNLSTHESSEKTNQNRCIFDLNEDVYLEESSDCLINSTLHNAINVSAPIAVAASKGASFLPVSPLRFEGELGWKGSAATSAFRPPSPRRTPDVEKTSSGHKRKASLIEFDLNVVDSGVDPVHPVSVKSIPQEDSAEVSSGRPDRLKLDLNRVEDEDMPPIPSSLGSLPRLNGNQTMSPVSSSSSRQPTLRTFDLNDNPSFFDTTHNYKKISSKTENPGITIMGSNITEMKDHPGGTPSLMGNGPTIMPYGHFPIHAYGYNGHMMGPSISFPSPLYGHGNIPYMVDSRGANVVPQILTTAGLSSASSAIPPFLMSATNTSLGLNGAGTSQSRLDVNSMENGNFNNFLQGRHGLTEDQVRAASQPGGSMNMKEADSGWEPYNFMASWR